MQKADLKNTIKEEVPLQTCRNEDAMVLDDCALFWSIHLPKAGNVSNLINVFKD